VTLNPHLLLVPWSRKSRAIPPRPLWAVRPVQSLSAHSRVHFTFTFFMQLVHGGRGSVVGIETRYWLDGPGFETLSTLGTYWTYSGHPLLLVDFIYLYN